MFCPLYQHIGLYETEENLARQKLCVQELDYLADRFNLLIKRRLNCILKQTLIDELKSDLLLLIRDKNATKKQLNDFKQTFDLLHEKCQFISKKNQTIKRTKQLPSSSSILSGNNSLQLLIQDNDSVYILDEHFNIIKYIEWKSNSLSKPTDASWSLSLNTFLVLTSINLYTINTDEYRLFDICKRGSYRACTSNQQYLYITTGKRIEIFNLFTMKYIRGWNINENDEFIEKISCSSDGQTVSLLTYEKDLETKTIDKVIYICHFETMEYLHCLSISSIQYNCLWILIAHSIFSEWNIMINPTQKRVIMMNINSSENDQQAELCVNEPMPNDIIHATIMSQEFMAIQTDDNKLYISKISCHQK
jgi:hypothetical protein